MSASCVQRRAHVRSSVIVAASEQVRPTCTFEAGWGNPAHDADIRHQIRFGAAAGTVPMGTHSGAVHLVIGPNGSGKS